MNSNNFSFESLKAHSLKITWKIPKYFSLPEVLDYSIDSSPFFFANATWCLRLYPNEHLGAFVSLLRLHSLIWYHKLLCKFDVLMRNGKLSNVEQGYCKLKYNEDFRERKYYIGEIFDRSGTETVQKFFTANGTLVIVCHLLFEELTDDDQFLQKCETDCSNIHKRREMQNKSDIISLKSSKAQSMKIMWKIPEYFSLPKTVGYSLSSPSFNFGFATWFLKLYPNGTKDDSDTPISLSRSQCIISLVHAIICTFDIIVHDEKHYNNEYIKISFSENNELKNTYLSFDDRFTLFEDHSVIAADGNITFLCHIFYEEPIIKDDVAENLSREIDTYRKFGQDLKNLLLNGKGHDLILKVKEKEFRVHRSILSSRSQVFESMLTHDMTEKNSGVVDIPDCDPQAMEQFLLYVYGCKVDSLNETNMLGLYYVSDKYDMISLKEECRNFIRNSFSFNNFCDVVQLAMNHSDEVLLESATDFFVNNSDEIISNAEWISFTKKNRDVANKLLNKASREMTDEK